MSNLLLSLLACTPADLTPAWAYDPIWIEPMGDGGIYGFESWQIYGPKWQGHYNDRYYVCSVVVELEGTPADSCDAEDGCTYAWDVTPTPSQTDCPNSLEGDPLFESLERIAFGGPNTSPNVAWPGQTTVGYADYGNGWEVHGEAYPEALDDGGQTDADAWDGTEPYFMVPTSSFPLQQ